MTPEQLANKAKDFQRVVLIVEALAEEEGLDPYVTGDFDGVHVGIYSGENQKDRLATVARVLKRYGTVDKTVSPAGYLQLSLKLPGGTQVKASSPGLCERVQVGTKVVEATEETIIPAAPAREEPVYEWKCPESILA